MEDKTEIERLSRDIKLLSGFVHGDESASVDLGGVDTPSLRALVAGIKTGVATLTERISQYDSRLATLEALLEGFGQTVTDGETAYTVQPLGSFSQVAAAEGTTDPNNH